MKRQTELLLDRLQSQNVRVRATAARLLGGARDPEAIGPLLTALQDEAAQVRAEAAQALGILADARSLAALIEASFDGHSTVRARAVRALGDLGDVASAEAVARGAYDRDKGVRAAAEAAIVQLGSAVEPAFCRLLSHIDHMVRAGATAGLRLVGTAACAPFLCRSFSEQTADAHYWAVEALARIQDPACLPALRLALHDEEATIRDCAVLALGRIGDPDALDSLAAVLTDPVEFVRMDAAWAIGAIRHPLGIGALCSAVASIQSMVRYEAVLGLILIADSHTVSPRLGLVPGGGLYDIRPVGLLQPTGPDGDGETPLLAVEARLQELDNPGTVPFRVVGAIGMTPHDRARILETLSGVKVKTPKGQVVRFPRWDAAEIADKARDSDDPAVRQGGQELMDYLTCPRAADYNRAQAFRTLVRPAGHAGSGDWNTLLTPAEPPGDAES